MISGMPIRVAMMGWSGCGRSHCHNEKCCTLAPNPILRTNNHLSVRTCRFRSTCRSRGWTHANSLDACSKARAAAEMGGLPCMLASMLASGSIGRLKTLSFCQTHRKKSSFVCLHYLGKGSSILLVFHCHWANTDLEIAPVKQTSHCSSIC